MLSAQQHCHAWTCLGTCLNIQRREILNYKVHEEHNNYPGGGLCHQPRCWLILIFRDYTHAIVRVYHPLSFTDISGKIVICLSALSIGHYIDQMWVRHFVADMTLTSYSEAVNLLWEVKSLSLWEKKNLFLKWIFSNLFIVDKVVVDLEPMLGTLGVR